MELQVQIRFYVNLLTNVRQVIAFTITGGTGCSGHSFSAGGRGRWASAVINVSAISVINIFVGGQGAFSSESKSTSEVTGGYNGNVDIYLVLA